MRRGRSFIPPFSFSSSIMVRARHCIASHRNYAMAGRPISLAQSGTAPRNYYLTRCAELPACTSQLPTRNALHAEWLTKKYWFFSIKTLTQAFAISDFELCRLSFYNMIFLKLLFILYHLICENKHAKPKPYLNILPKVLYNRMTKGLLRHRLGFDNTPINA